MPKLIALLITGIGVSPFAFASVFKHVADRAEVDDFPGFPECDVFRFGFPQFSGEGDLGLIIHRLFGKTKERVAVDGLLDFLYGFIGYVPYQRNTPDLCSKIRVQRFEVQTSHGWLRIQTSSISVRTSPSPR